MRKTTITLALLMACVFVAPAQAARYDTAAGAKQGQSADLVAKKGGKAKKSKKA